MRFGACRTSPKAFQQLSYPFRFLGALRETDGLFRWCVRTIHAGDIQLQSAPQAIKAIASGAL
jgi:hypothetical protein